jgi:hypothetical protein
MNCQVAQKKIRDALAGEAVPPPDVASHQANCAECRAFCEKHRQLFASINAGVQSAVNQPVPLSFFVRLRAQLDQPPAPRSLWAHRWTYAAVATTVVLAVTLVVLRNPAPRRDSNSEPNRVIARTDHWPASEPLLRSPETVRPRVAPIRANKRATLHPSEAVPEVITEEQQTFARFLARVPQGTGLASALKPSVPQPTDAPIDIALIEIQEVEIARLESMNGDGQ